MKALKFVSTLGLAIGLSLSPVAWADDDRDTEGPIESINQQSGSFIVNGMEFHTDGNTDYDDDLKNFSDLKVGQKVEVDYVMRDGRRIAEEIELDD